MSRAPLVDPMMVRRFIPRGEYGFWGGVFVMDAFDVEDVGPAAARYPTDADIVDCSNRIFEITNAMIMFPKRPLEWSAFPIRRWRNCVEDITAIPLQANVTPSVDHSLLYIGNPIPLDADDEGVRVGRLREFIIKSGVELGY